MSKAQSKNTAGYVVDFVKKGRKIEVTYESGETQALTQKQFDLQFNVVTEEVPSETKDEGVDEMIIATVDFKGVAVPLCEGEATVVAGPCRVELEDEVANVVEVNEAGGFEVLENNPVVEVNGDIADSNETVVEQAPTEEEQLSLQAELNRCNNLGKGVDEPFSEESFEQWIARTCSGVSDIPIELSIKGSTKVRDSARVAFLENKKAFERTQATLNELSTKEPTPEVIAELNLLEKDLGKYSDRARKYYSRYSNAKEVLATEKEKALKLEEEQAQAKFDAAQEAKMEGSNEEA